MTAVNQSLQVNYVISGAKASLDVAYDRRRFVKSVLTVTGHVYKETKSPHVIPFHIYKEAKRRWSTGWNVIPGVLNKLQVSYNQYEYVPARLSAYFQIIDRGAVKNSLVVNFGSISAQVENSLIAPYDIYKETGNRLVISFGSRNAAQNSLTVRYGLKAQPGEQVPDHTKVIPCDRIYIV